MYNDNTIFEKIEGNFVNRKIGDEYLIVPLKGDLCDLDKVYILNEVGNFILDAINGINTIREIVELIASEFEVSKEIAMRDTIQFLDTLITIRAVKSIDKSGTI